MKLFNKGIYKSTIKRFSWGSVFWLAILLLVTVLPLVMFFDPVHESPELQRFAEAGIYHPQLRYGDFIVYRLLLIATNFAAMAVPTVVAMLVYRFMHSKKQSVFIHSMPIKREENYISTLSAALTLMIIPIVIVGAVLMLMMYSGYGYIVDAAIIWEWIKITIVTIFILFAYSTFASMLTGNTFAALALNVLIFVLPTIADAISGTLGGTYLYGYISSYNIIGFALDIHPVGWIMNAIAKELASMSGTETPSLATQLVIAVVVYVVSFVLYKKRRVETAGDVAGFKILNPIFKYTLTLIVALIFLAEFEAGKTNSAMLLVMVAVSALVYFAVEAALKKTFKVWKSYKGLLAFAAVFGVGVYLITNTSFFGYETRVPDVDDIASVAIFRMDYSKRDEPFVESEKIKEYAINKHKEFIEAGKKPEGGGDWIDIKYKLRNGTEIWRRYTDTAVYETEKELYEYDEYKFAREDVFNEGLENATRFLVGTVTIPPERCRELVECLRMDVIENDFCEMYFDKQLVWSETVRANYMLDGKEMSFSTKINANYKNTMAFLDTIDEWIAKKEIPGQWAYFICERSDYSAPIYRIYPASEVIKTNEFLYNYEISEDDATQYAVCYTNGSGYTPIAYIDAATLSDLLELVDETEVKYLTGSEKKG